MRQTTRPLLVRIAVAVLLSSIVACGDGSGSIRLSDAPSTTAAGAVGSKVGDPPPRLTTTSPMSIPRMPMRSSPTSTATARWSTPIRARAPLHLQLAN